MKRNTICLLLLAVNMICTAQINNFWGVKFGASIQETQNIMNKKKGLEEDMVFENSLYYKPHLGGVALFASQPIKGISLSFHENKFYHALIRLDDDTYTLKSFKRIEANLIKKYGNPTKSINDTDFNIYKRIWINGKNSIKLERILQTSTLDLTYEHKTYISSIKESDMDDL